MRTAIGKAGCWSDSRFKHSTPNGVKRKFLTGFTLVELMAVIFIISVLAAVAIQFMRGRVDSAKWSEGKAAAGSIRTAARSFSALKGQSWSGNWAGVALPDLGFDLVDGASGDDLDGKYFTNEAYSVAFTGYDQYTVTVNSAASLSPDKPTTPTTVTLDQDGMWTKAP